MHTERKTPLDAAYRAAGITSDYAVSRRGGPCERSLCRLRRGRVLRGDAVTRLARVLGVTEREAHEIVRATAAAATSSEGAKS